MTRKTLQNAPVSPIPAETAPPAGRPSQRLATGSKRATAMRELPHILSRWYPGQISEAVVAGSDRLSR